MRKKLLYSVAGEFRPGSWDTCVSEGNSSFPTGLLVSCVAPGGFPLVVPPCETHPLPQDTYGSLTYQQNLEYLISPKYPTGKIPRFLKSFTFWEVQLQGKEHSDAVDLGSVGHFQWSCTALCLCSVDIFSPCW